MKSVLLLTFCKINATVDFYIYIFFKIYIYIYYIYRDGTQVMTQTHVTCKSSTAEHVRAHVLITRPHGYIVNIY